MAAILALVFAWAMVMHGLGWAQTSYFAQVRALDTGQPQIDDWHWETKDKAWMHDHFYSVKAPGLAMLTTPAYSALDELGAWGAAETAAGNARDADSTHWVNRPVRPYLENGYDARIAAGVSISTERQAPIVWVLALIGAVIPALIMLLVVRSLGDRYARGFGAVAAVTLGLGTVVMSFASEYFSHVIAAALGIGAFALLVRERESGQTPGAAPWLAAAAGLCCGLAVTFEYPLGLVGIVLFGYLLSRPEARLPRAAAYSAGAVLGAVPALAFNQWAFGNPLEFAYGNAVDVQGFSGHEALGLNSDGFFGITSPKGDAAIDLLFASRGLLVLTPVIAMALAGVIALRRSEAHHHRAEANTILAVFAVYFLYTCGYWLPFGGGSPGPRFLIPALPFVALGLAVAWKRWPALTLATAIPSAVYMVSAAVTKPLIGEEGTAVWAHMLFIGDFEHTPLTALGVHSGWIAILPVFAAVFAAAALAARSMPAIRLGNVRWAAGALMAWALVAYFGPSVAGDPVTPRDPAGEETIQLIGLALALSLATLAVLRYRELREVRAPAGSPGGSAASAGGSPAGDAAGAPVPVTAFSEPSR